jgi:hypothetical protein
MCGICHGEYCAPTFPLLSSRPRRDMQNTSGALSYAGRMACADATNKAITMMATMTAMAAMSFMQCGQDE